MSVRFNNKYRIPSNRLQGYDYGSNGAYFVTICTNNRSHYFGSIHSKEGGKRLAFTEIGNIAFQYWINIPEHFPFVWLDEFQVMPDHIHGIAIINRTTQNPASPECYQNKFGPQTKNLSSIIRGYKAAVKSYATKKRIEFNWQERFHDHIIRDEDDLKRIRKYIRRNIEDWEIK